METLATTLMLSKGQVVIPDSIRKQFYPKRGMQFICWQMLHMARGASARACCC